jgi:hypothetical protein
MTQHFLEGNGNKRNAQTTTLPSSQQRNESSQQRPPSANDMVWVAGQMPHSTCATKVPHVALRTSAAQAQHYFGNNIQ